MSWSAMAAGKIRPQRLVALTPSGFTLVEILLALSIFAVVVSVVYGMYRTTFTSLGGAENYLNEVRGASIVSERFTDDLLGLVLYPDAYLVARDSVTDSEQAARLSFMTTSCLDLSRNGPAVGRCLVGYETELMDDQSISLYRTETLLYAGAGEEGGELRRRSLLAKDLREIRLVYVDGDGAELLSWQTTASPGEGQEQDKALALLPERILLSLRYGADDGLDDDGQEYPTIVRLTKRVVESEGE